jgi:AraC-like DNA-binding protein
MYIERVPNRASPPAVLLRESVREGGKVRKRTLANLSDWPVEKVEALRAVLSGSGPAAPAFRWNVTSDPKSRSYRHRVPSGHGHGALAPLVAGAFRFLRISASVTVGPFWWSLSNAPDLIPFEVEHGAEQARYRYNDACLKKAFDTGAPVLGNFAGYSDWFVPIVSGSDVRAALVAGPFLRARPEAAEILTRWHDLTGTVGEPTDPAFAAYLSVVLSTLLLEGRLPERFGEFLQCLAQLMAGRGSADAAANRADALRVELQRARSVEAAWDAVDSMLDDRSPRIWSSAARSFALGELGLSRVPDHVLVGLSTSTSPNADALEEALRRHDLQRATVGLARDTGNAIAGKVGEHGVVLLCAAGGTVARGRATILELVARVSTAARRKHGLALHFGASAAPGSAKLSASYQAALEAAEAALVSGRPLVLAESVAERSGASLRHLRDELERAVEQRADLAPARFDRYLEMVAIRCGYRMEAVRGYLDSGFERMARPLVRSGDLDPRSFRELCDRLDRASASARTVSELFTVYRQATADLSAAALAPVTARHARNLRRALEHIREHCAEPLRAAKVARVAGYAPNYFSKLFRAKVGQTFAAHLSALRIDKARILLEKTKLSATRIAALSGFASSQHFSRAFARAIGTTPIGYRNQRTQKI